MPTEPDPVTADRPAAADRPIAADRLPLRRRLLPVLALLLLAPWRPSARGVASPLTISFRC